MLQLLGVKKTFSHRKILDINDLVFAPGFHWVKGENGSGKTSLLRILGGLLPFDGDVLLNGISLKHNGLAYRQNISWAEAEPVYPAFLHGKDLARLYRNVRNASESETAELITVFGLADYLDAPCGAYSAGTVKRLSLLLAFTGLPRYILLDEPLATLDTSIAGVLSHLMMEMQRQHGTSFIYSSHQPFPLPGFPAERSWVVAGQTIIPEQ